MYGQQAIWVGSSGDGRHTLRLEQVNRHGLIAGATGTGKTITLKMMAEPLNDAGVPVLLADVKEDLADVYRPGGDSTSIQAHIARFGLQGVGFRYRAYPTEFWDIFGKRGLPLRTTVSEFRLLLFARLLDLNKIQSDLLEIVFRIADEEGFLFLDAKDLKSMVRYVEENADACRERCGNIGKSGIGAMFRALVALEGKDDVQFFGEPALQIPGWIRIDADGRGYVNILDLASLIQDPTVYSTSMLWMLNELFTELPEAGGLEKPRMVFFFDEAHLLFDNAPKTLLDKIEQVIKLIRSKGIGVYFITQNPLDIPGGVLAQLSNKVQHAPCAYTPTEQKGIKITAESFRKNPTFDTATTLQKLKTAKALVSFLNKDGVLEGVQIASILPPQPKFSALDAITRQAAILASSLRDKYAGEADRESAYEFLLQRIDEQATTTAKAKKETEAEKQVTKEVAAAEKQAAEETTVAEKQAAKEAAAAAKQAEKEATVAAREEKKKVAQQKHTFTSTDGSVTGTIGREVGKRLGKSVGGSLDKQLDDNVGTNLGRGILKALLEF